MISYVLRPKKLLQQNILFKKYISNAYFEAFSVSLNISIKLDKVESEINQNKKMKLLIFLALFAAIAYALPVEEIGQNQEIEESPLNIVDFEADSSAYENSDVAREKRQYGG